MFQINNITVLFVVNMTKKKQHRSISTLVDMLDKSTTGVKFHSSLQNRHYIESVKQMDYDEFVATLQCIAHDISFLNTSEYIQFTENQLNFEQYYISMDCEEYPIVIGAVEDMYHFKGVSPLQLVVSLTEISTQTSLFIPIVIESFIDNEYSHQMTFIIDTITHVMFIHDPNGSSRYSDERVHNLFKHYVDSINTVLLEYGMVKYEYIIPPPTRMNFELKYIGGHNCVLASMTYIILYNQLSNVNLVDEILQNVTHSEYLNVYTSLLNTLGSHLIDYKSNK
jgi:hypothetical protein